MAAPGLWDELNAWRQAVTSPNCDLPGITRLVLLVLATYAEPQGLTCFPSEVTLAGRTGLSERSVRNHLNLAERGAWITRQRIPRAGRAWFYTEYTLQLPAAQAAGHTGSRRNKRQRMSEQPAQESAHARHKLPLNDLREFIKENKTMQKAGLRGKEAQEPENPEKTAKLLAEQFQDPQIETAYLSCVGRIGVVAARQTVLNVFSRNGFPTADVLRQSLESAVPVSIEPGEGR